MRALMIAAALLLAIPASGELNAQVFSGVETGQLVRIRTTEADSVLIGTVVAVNGDSAVIDIVRRATFAERVAVRARDVASVEVSRRTVGPWRKGALIGGLALGVGSALATAPCLADSDWDEECPIVGLAITAGGAVGGALIGALIGAALRTSTWEPVGALPAGSAFTLAPAGAGRIELRGSILVGGR